MQHIENLCNQFSNITIKPILYDLLIKDFTILADLYLSNNEYEYNNELQAYRVKGANRVVKNIIKYIIMFLYTIYERI